MAVEKVAVVTAGTVVEVAVAVAVAVAAVAVMAVVMLTAKRVSKVVVVVMVMLTVLEAAWVPMEEEEVFSVEVAARRYLEWATAFLST